MRKLTFWLLLLFVFSLPWEPVVLLGPFGSASRFLGSVAIVVGLLAAVARGQVRRPGVVLWLTAAFVFSNVLTFLWTISPEATTERVLTYTQLLAITWLVWEFVREPVEHDVVLAAYCLGAVVAMVDAFRNFSGGISAVAGAGPLEARYAATNFDPNDFGLTLALAIPMAWYLFLASRRTIRFLLVSVIPLAVVAILLTASRAASLGGLVALLFIPLTQVRNSMRSLALTAALLVSGVGAALIVVPPASWARVLTAGDELQGGTMSGRTAIWEAGLEAFNQHPILGVGAGAFGSAVEPVVGSRASHNAPLAILIEQGIVGFAIFIALLSSCVWCVFRLPPTLRALWGVLLCTWLVGAMSLSWQYTKITWFLFALLAARSASTVRESASNARQDVDGAAIQSRRARAALGATGM